MKKKRMALIAVCLAAGVLLAASDPAPTVSAGSIAFDSRISTVDAGDAGTVDARVKTSLRSNAMPLRTMRGELIIILH